MTQPNYYGQPIYPSQGNYGSMFGQSPGQNVTPVSVGNPNAPADLGMVGNGATVGNFGSVAAANTLQGNGQGSQIGNLGTPIKDLNAPQIGYDQNYGDYQNFGSIAQQYGAAGAGQLNTPAIQNALSRSEMGANGNLLGQHQLANASGILGEAAQGRSASQNLLSSAAQGLQPSAAEIQQRQGIQQGLAQAQAQAASTRGNFGLANAEKQAQAAQAQGAIANASQGAALRANEMANARAAYAGAQGAAQGQYGQTAAAQANNQLLGVSQNAGAQFQNQQSNLGYLNNMQNLYSGQSNTALNAAIAQGNLDLGQNAQNVQQQIAQNNLMQNYVSGGTSAFGGLMMAAALSDERAKEDIRPAGEIFSQLDHFKPVHFGYKSASDTPNQQAADAPQVGVLAQDVEQGPAGRMLIRHMPDGRKALDVPSLTGVLAAGEGALKQVNDNHEMRLSRLEKLLRGAA